MRSVLPAVVALVVGLLVGAWQPRGEVLALRAEVETLRLEARRPRAGEAAQGIRSILRAPPVAEAAGAPEATGAPDAPAGEAAEARPTPPRRRPGPEDMKALRTGLDARAAQARAALIEQADLTDEELAEVDEAMAAMNEQLRAEVDAFVADALAAGEVDRRAMMELAAGALDVTIGADDALREALPEEVYLTLDEAVVDPFSYVDGTVVASLARLEGLPGFEE